MSEAKEYLFGAALGAGGVATLWIGVEAGTLFGAAALTGLFAFGAVCRYRMLNAPVAAREAVVPSFDGWFDWAGGECPVLDCVRVDVRFRDGRVAENHDPSGWVWFHNVNERGDRCNSDIIAYRVTGEKK